jgi:hypothetical protein
MAKQGDWGGGGKEMVPKIVTREGFVENATVTRGEERPAQGPAPKLKHMSHPEYQRAPFDPEYRNLDAKGSDEVTPGQ